MLDTYSSFCELDGVRRLTAAVEMHGQPANSDAALRTTAWLRMLMVIPGMSEARARRVVDKYPTFKSLFDVYTQDDMSEALKANLLAVRGPRRARPGVH